MKKKICMSIDYEDGMECLGVPLQKIEHMDLNLVFSDEEIIEMKKLVKSSTLDKDAGLMPILEKGNFVIYFLTDVTIQAAIQEHKEWREKNSIAIFNDKEPEKFEFVESPEKFGECEAVPYICHIPESLM